MVTKEEIDAAEEGFLRVYGHTRPGVRAAIKFGLEAAEQIRENERIRNCKHINKHGSGMIGGNDPYMNWSCDDCGSVWREPQKVLDHHHDWTHPLIREDRPE